MATTIHGQSLCLFGTYPAKRLLGVLPNCNFPSSMAASKLRCIRSDEISESHEGTCGSKNGWCTGLCSFIVLSPSTSEAASYNDNGAFSVVKTDIPCDIGSVWSSIGFYVFSIHVPLSFGGLSVATKILHQPILDSQIEAFLVLIIQILELSIVLLLLRCRGKPQYELIDFFNVNKSSRQRSWLLTSVLGVGFLFSLVFITSIIAEGLMVPKDVNNPFLKQILSSSSSSVIACTLVYCIVTPFLEEVVYRGFLLTSLSSKMKWQQAVIISSIIFSAAHFSGENFLQLFIVGLVLGSSYCWTGNLSSSLAIHSLYNALTLFATYMS